jgi:hypothetical protein
MGDGRAAVGEAPVPATLPDIGLTSCYVGHPERRARRAAPPGQRMTWLLALYPPRWRHRYGDELRSLVASQPFSFQAAVDLIAGAIDAWLEPQKLPMQPAPAGEEGVTMIGP